jgi:WD40 repeat protein
MKPVAVRSLLVFALGCLGAGTGRAADDPRTVAANARGVLERYCYRCHGRDGSLEGGMNYVLDRDKLIARKKVLPGDPLHSPLYKRVAAGKMPPPDEQPRPSAADIVLLKRWIEGGALSALPPQPERRLLSEATVFALVRDDLEKLDRRSRRFARYFSLAHLYNLGLSADELQTYRNALAKLLNSLSWHPRITLPRPVDKTGTVLRIDLRDFMWDANLWNRLVAEYPYAVLHDTAVARAAVVNAAARVPVVRADWFIATASRPPLYYELLQIPGNANELERQLRVDVTQNIQQERVARAGFNGSGVSRNNRVLERHDSVHGAYWRTYDFEAVPQNLIERDLLLPDRRNLFAYPLGPGSTESTFQHAGGEIIFNLPNGLQGYMLVNAVNNRIDKGPTAIVSDPRRPDRAVEVGVSCMACHVPGIIQKADQIRDHVAKNKKYFSRQDAELIRALYVPAAKMKKLMDEDSERYRKALAKTGNRVSNFEPVSTLTLRFEADVDLPTAAAEVGLKPKEFLNRVLRDEAAVRNLGGLKVPGGTVSRQVIAQSFGDVVRVLRLGTALQAGATGQALPDNSGEVDPLEGQSSQVNGAAISADGRRVLLASADKSVRLWDVEAGRDLRRFIGHTGSVWAVAFSPDGKRALSGGADQTVRLWDVDSGSELRRFEGHAGLVLCVAFAPDGKQALSAALDHSIVLWDVETGKEVRRLDGLARFINAVVLAPSGKEALLCGDDIIHLVDLKSGKELRTFTGHTASVTSVAFSPDGKQVVSASDDGTVRLWETASGRVMRSFIGHDSYVKGVAFSTDGKRILSGGTDTTVRLWDANSGKELRRFGKHSATVLTVAFAPDDRSTVSAGNDAEVRLWELEKAKGTEPIPPAVETQPVQEEPKRELKPVRIIPVGGTVGNLMLSPNRRWLYYLNLSEGKLARLDTEHLGRPGVLPLIPGTEVVTLTPDGQTLVAVAGSEAKGGTGKLQLIDSKKWALRKALSFEGVPFDVAADDKGRVYVSGGRGEWTDITVLDTAKDTVLGRWGGVWSRSFLRLSQDQKRLYFSTQGVSPGYVEALVIPRNPGDKPASHRSPAREGHKLGGDFLLTSDGRFLLSKTGTVLRTGVGQETDLRYETTLAPFLAAAVDVEGGSLFLCMEDGSLRQYGYPDFKLRATYRLPGVGYQAACDGKSGRLYVAVFDPKALTARPRGRGFGELHVFETKSLLTKK